MVGILLMMAGVLRMGWIANLLSGPVTTGFLAGISLHIVLSQAPSVLGLPEVSGDIYHRLSALWAEAGSVSLASAAIGFGVFAVVAGGEALNARAPGALIALGGATLATLAFHLERHGVVVLGRIPGAFPHLVAPRLGFEDALHLVGLAFVVSLVVMVQTAATTRSFSGDDGDPDVGRDYVGVGAGSLLAGLFGAFPVNASPPRTAIVAGSGGESQWTGLVAALAVLLLSAFGTSLLDHVPAAALGGVLLFIAMRIFHLHAFAEILRRTWAEFGLAILTVGLILALPIETGVAIGMFLSLAHGVFTITRARPIPFERVPGTTVWWPALTPTSASEPHILVIGFQAPLSFLNAYEFRRGVMAAIEQGRGVVRLLVLEASSIVEVDFTASAILLEVIDAAHRAGMDFAVARLESLRAQAAFARFGVTDRIGADHLFHSVDMAIRTLQTVAPQKDNKLIDNQQIS